MPDPVFHYYGTERPVKVGDRILVHRVFGRAGLATVVYIPGQSQRDAEIGDDQWAYKLDDGSVYAGGFFPSEIPHPGKRIEFVFRPGEEAQEVIKAYRIPLEERARHPGRDFLALIGCGALLLIVPALAAMAWGAVCALFNHWR